MVEARSREEGREPSGHRWDRRYRLWLIGDPSERRARLGSQTLDGGAVAVGGRVAGSPLSPLVANRLAGGLVREDAEGSQMSLRC